MVEFKRFIKTPSLIGGHSLGFIIEKRCMKLDKRKRYIVLIVEESEDIWRRLNL